MSGKKRLIFWLPVIAAFLACYIGTSLYLTSRSEREASPEADTQLAETGEQVPATTPASTPEPTPVPTEAPEPTSSPGLESEPRDIAELESEIDAMLTEASYTSRIGVYVEGLTGGSHIEREWNDSVDYDFFSDTMILLFVMGAVHDKLESGDIEETDEIYVDLALMIWENDTDAANNLVLLLGGDEAEDGRGVVNEFAAKIGCTGTAMLRLMEDTSTGRENFTTPGDCALILRLIYEGRCVTARRSLMMLELLLSQPDDSMIPAGIAALYPKDALPKNVKAANKTGSLNRLCQGDAAIVLTDSGDYIISVIANPEEAVTGKTLSNPLDNDYSAQIIRDVSAQVYDFFTYFSLEKEK